MLAGKLFHFLEQRKNSLRLKQRMDSYWLGNQWLNNMLWPFWKSTWCLVYDIYIWLQVYIDFSFVPNIYGMLYRIERNLGTEMS